MTALDMDYIPSYQELSPRSWPNRGHGAISPRSRQKLEAPGSVIFRGLWKSRFKGVPEDEKRFIVRDNVARLYGHSIS